MTASLKLFPISHASHDLSFLQEKSKKTRASKLNFISIVFLPDHCEGVNVAL
jgi:hypothetical protein